MNSIINLSGYKFIELTQLEELKAQLRQLCLNHELKGTILLASEGININLAGKVAQGEAFLTKLKEHILFADITFKKSYSDFVPFQRLFVKIKKEIIAFAIPSIEPAKMTGKRLPAQLLKQWLDEKKDIAILDVRNNNEIEIGKFAEAKNLDISHFRAFPEAVKKLLPEWKNKTIVTYCTGGVRCEKATAYMLQQGFDDVYQLEGGILQYFIECGDAYYQGKCFIYDDRGALDADLK